MADVVTCEVFDEWSAELAFELVEPEWRDALLAHTAGCDRCRRELQSLSATADLLSLLAPDGEPPVGFEQRAVAAMVPHRRSRWSIGLAAAAVLLLVVGIGIGIGSWRSDDAKPDYRAAALTDASGHSFGSVSLSWSGDVVLTMTLKHLDAGTYHCVLQYRDGRVEDIAAWPVGADGTGVWAVPLQVDASTVHAVLVSDEHGAQIAAAVLR